MNKKTVLPLTLAIAMSFTGLAQDSGQTSDQPLPRAEDEIREESQQAGEDVEREGQQTGEDIRREGEQTGEDIQREGEELGEGVQQKGEEVQQEGHERHEGMEQRDQEYRQEQQSGRQAGSPAVSNFEKSVALNQIHHVNQKEIELAKIAQEQGQSQEIKDMAKLVLDDHQKNDQQLQSLAKSEGVKLSDYQPSGAEKATIDQLKELKGADFDKAFGSLMHQSHAMTSQSLQMISRETDDPQVKQFVTQLIPKVRQHEQRSQKFSS